MKKTYNYQHLELLHKYRKFFTRYQKQLKNGIFGALPKNKQESIIHRIKRIAKQLTRLRLGFTRLAATAAFATVLPAIPGAYAQHYTQITGAGDPFSGAMVSLDAHPVFVDIDGDGDLDAFVGNDAGIAYFKNTGNSSVPVFSLNSSLSTVNSGKRNAAFADIDGDGDFDMTVADQDGGYYFWQFTNTGSSSAFSFQTPGATSSLFGYHCGDAQPTFADIDGDGDMDFFFGTNLLNGLMEQKNTGSSTVPAFASQTTLISTSGWTSPAFIDFDSDGDLDLFIGQADGTIRYFKNTGNSTTPSFTEITGTGNPFNGIDVGDRATLTLADIDNDLLPEAVVGNALGNIKYFHLPTSTGIHETVQNPTQLFLADQVLNIRLDKNASLKGALVSIYNSIGQLIYENKLEKIQTQISMEGFKTGIYFVSINSISGKENKTIFLNESK